MAHRNATRERVVKKKVSRRASAQSLQRKRNGNVEIDWFLDGRRKSSGGIGIGGVTEGKERVEASGPRGGSIETADGIGVVRIVSGKRGERKAEKQMVVQK